MAVSADGSGPAASANDKAGNELPSNSSTTAPRVSPKTSLDTKTASRANSVDPTAEFSGDLETNNVIPTLETLRKVQDITVLDKDGKSLAFKSVYSGSNVARRILVIFVRHFFCGNCQEYLRTLSSSITPESLLQLPTPTFIAIIGCGSPSLIPMYQEATSCPFPIYADPTRRLYEELGMTRTLALGSRPEYIRKSLLSTIVLSVVQGLKQIKSGGATKGGDVHQVGGEFLFEPLSFATSLEDGEEPPTPITSLEEDGENKRVTWCHRMRNTRDHAEIPELREVLGLDGLGVPGRNSKRWDKAVGERKGTGLSSTGSAGRASRDLNNENPAPAAASSNGIP